MYRNLQQNNRESNSYGCIQDERVDEKIHNRSIKRQLIEGTNGKEISVGPPLNCAQKSLKN